MKTFFKKQFCLWLVSPEDGRVKKVRFSLGTVFSGMTAVSLAGALALFIVGGYTRTSFQELSQSVSLNRLASERNTLRRSNNSLQSAIQRLQTEQEQAEGFQEDVRKRLSELSSIVSTARSLGIVPKKTGQKRSMAGVGDSEDQGALGGLETDCKDSRCFADSDSDSLLGAVRSSLVREDSKDMVELLHELDFLVDTLRLIPIGSPTLGRLSSGYGVRISPFSRRARMHHGLDLAAPYGSKVFATADGVVKSVKRHRTYGLMIDIAHGDGGSTMTRFAHLSKALVSEGQKVSRSEPIGQVGSSGLSTGPHLHYEVRVGGRTKNPYPLVKLGSELGDWVLNS